MSQARINLDEFRGGSYRGYDTLGETTVIFTAGIGVLLLIGRSKTHSGK